MLAGPAAGILETLAEAAEAMARFGRVAASVAVALGTTFTANTRAAGIALGGMAAAAATLATGGSLKTAVGLLERASDDAVASGIGKSADAWRKVYDEIAKGTAKVRAVSEISTSGGLKKYLADVDAVIAMGAEAGGNLAPEELTTMVVVPQVVDRTGLPVIAAGGICDARGFIAALALGAEGIQMGTRILATKECTVHPNYKEALLKAGDTDTTVTGRSTGLEFRVLKNKLSGKIHGMEKAGRAREEIDAVAIGGLRRAAVEGDMEKGSVMMGQIAGMISDVRSVRELFDQIMSEASEKIGEVSRLFGLHGAGATYREPDP